MVVARSQIDEHEVTFQLKGSSVQVHGQPGTIAHVGPAWIVVWSFPPSDRCNCSQAGVVA